MSATSAESNSRNFPRSQALTRIGAPRFGGISDWRRAVAITLVLTDAGVMALSLSFAHLYRFGAADQKVAGAGWEYSVLGVAIAVVWLISLSATRSRATRVLGAGTVEYQQVTKATLLTFGALSVTALLADLDLARGYLAVAFPLGLLLLLAGRYAVRSWLVARRREGRMLTGALVLGSDSDARRVLKQLRANPAAGYVATGVAFTHTDPESARSGQEPLPGSDVDVVPVFPYEDLVTVVRARRVGAVVVAGDLPGGSQQLKELGWRLENSGIEMILMSRLTDVAGPRIHMRPIDGLPMVHVDLPQYSGVNHVAKRAADLVMAIAALVVFAIPMLILAALIKLDSPGPAIFKQERIGVGGTRFTMYKFRSMVPDAEARRAALLDANEGNAVLFKLRADPRITRLGRFLRRYSLDELPQLFNIVRGDMSVVGPRPPLPEEVAKYEQHATRRLLIKPGVTGLWQVSGRSNLSWDETVRLDLYYVENWSIVGDILILLKTARAVLARDGAY